MVASGLLSSLAAFLFPILLFKLPEILPVAVGRRSLAPAGLVLPLGQVLLAVPLFSSRFSLGSLELFLGFATYALFCCWPFACSVVSGGGCLSLVMRGGVIGGGGGVFGDGLVGVAPAPVEVVVRHVDGWSSWDSVGCSIPGALVGKKVALGG